MSKHGHIKLIWELGASGYVRISQDILIYLFDPVFDDRCVNPLIYFPGSSAPHPYEIHQT
jgi:hypothetical protein